MEPNKTHPKKIPINLNSEQTNTTSWAVIVNQTRRQRYIPITATTSVP